MGFFGSVKKHVMHPTQLPGKLGDYQDQMQNIDNKFQGAVNYLPNQAQQHAPQGSPGMRPGFNFNRATGKYNPAPPPQGGMPPQGKPQGPYNNFGDMAHALNSGGMPMPNRNPGRPAPQPQMQAAMQGMQAAGQQAGINPRLAPRTYPMQGNPSMGSPGMRPKGDGRTNPVPNQGPKILYR